ncbi:putative disease resistance RPP13-like protein 3 isoform X1 [Panicum miliaceum]|uniref:Disease resistance RPP13-like protein 3 isoform X1 n=1 Tax=Panicum miliaceum TaxID=4540 RepID=A0A3L6Q3C1_PANMI|nr:putative disease resistance RPP13-like protein 3 isoform X1 [Panicum miliaceum]
MRDIVTKAKTRHEIGQDIKDIKERVKEVGERRERYKVDTITPSKTSVDPRITSLYTKTADLVGIDDAREELITRMTKGDDMSTQQRIISVVGFGGLGKTTLAKAAYDKLKGQFNCTAFVPVGRNPDLKKVLRDISIDLDKQGYMHFNLEILDERQLIDKLQEFLENRRYFIVIDDVWETQSWGIIKLALVENNNGSRVIITTRTHEVAREAGEVYKLQPLSKENSRKLFFARIFGGESKVSDPQPDDEVLDKILRKCDGIPLALITMASLLVGKPREEWSEVHRSIGFGNNKENRQVENTLKILSFSYYDLPCHLRTCLLYLSVYPEDYMIDKRPLIWMWIGEGFVHEKQGMSSFEIGEGYFNELVNRSMIQLVEDAEGDAMECACQIHDMVLDLIRSISSEENFVAILDKNKKFGASSSSQGRSARRLAPQNNDIIMEARTDMQQLSARDTYFQGKMKRLHLKHLRNLIHLRCLRLLGSDFDLPEEVGTLKFLQTLEVEGMPMRKMDTFSVGLLTQLLCLRFRNTVWTVPDGFGMLMCLEELQISCFEHEEGPMRRFVKELGSLRELRVLRVAMNPGLSWDVRVQVDMVDSLRNLEKMEHLSLTTVSSPVPADTAAWEAAGFLPAHLQQLDVTLIRFSRFPSFCINPLRLPKLSHLSLHVDVLDEQDLRILGGLPDLRFLKLNVHSGAQVVCNNSSSDAADDGPYLFQKLRRCSLWCSELRLLLPSNDASFCMQYVRAYMLLGSGKRKDGVGVAPTLLPRVHKLRFEVRVREFKDGNNDDYGNLGLEYFASLQYATVTIDCRGASAAEVEELEAALRRAAEVHPNRPTLEVMRYGEEGMVSAAQDKESLETRNWDFQHHPIPQLGSRVTRLSFNIGNVMMCMGTCGLLIPCQLKRSNLHNRRFEH